MSLYSAETIGLANEVLEKCRAYGLMVVTAESCTGGLIAAALTDIAGSSDVFERGFVTYSNDAKMEMIGVQRETVTRYGAVSKETAREMVAGALLNSKATVSVAVTGVAGPGGGSSEKPVGLVHIAAAKGASMVHQEYRFGDIGREAVRLQTTRAALRLMLDIIDS